jgi:phosphoglycolate phosphatase-like HAD superfamily hydrolase
MIKGIILDYDGVIAESVDVKTTAFAELYKPFGYGIVQKVVQHHRANGGISRFEKFKLYHKSYLGLDLSDREIGNLSKEFSKLVLTQVIDSPYVFGALDFFKTCQTRYDLFISTGTPIEEIKLILKAKNTHKYFKEVYGSPASKISHIREILAKYQHACDELVFVGDAIVDRDSARKAGIKFIGRITTADEIKEEVLLMDDFTSLIRIIEKL